MGDNIWLQRQNSDIPWGFRISGGRDFQEPIKVSRVSGGSIASQSLVNGDLLLRISNADAVSLTNAQANDIIKNSGNTLQLTVAKDISSPAAHNASTGSSQVESSHISNASAVHDLFQDMYHHPTPLSLLDYQGGATKTDFNPNNQNNKSHFSKYNNNYNAKYKPTDLYSAFLDEYKPYGKSKMLDVYSDYNQNPGNSMIYRNYTPDNMLNTSTDSGVSLDNGSFIQRQNSNLSSHSSGADLLSTSNHSDNTNANNYEHSKNNSLDFPPPPPPFSLLNNKSPIEQAPQKRSWQPQNNKVNAREDLKEFSTKLEQQLASMDMNYGSNPSTPVSPYTPYSPPGRGYQSPGATHSPSNANYHPLSNIPPPPAPPMQSNSYSPMMSPNQYSPNVNSKKIPPRVPDKPAVPDAVLNMAAKGGSDKKPFAYAADMDEIKHHREKVRRKPGIPSYQNILNLPQFDDPPASTKLKPYNPNQPKQPEPPPQIPAGPGEGVVTHAQYNTPLGLYSAESAEEAFKAQSGGVVTSVEGLPGTKEKKDITESETYKMIHGINKPKPKAKVTLPAQHNYAPRAPAADDEMTFSGVLRPTDIPSKSFHRLQSLTDHQEGEIDTSSIRPQQQHLGDDMGVSGYDEASIRYLGKNIPSKSFRMLQNMTGGPDQPMSTQDQASNVDSQSTPASTVTTPIKQQPTPVATNTRRQRRRQRNQEINDTEPQAAAEEEQRFDEDDYLSGNVKIVSGSVNHPRPARAKVEVIQQVADEPPPENQREFDEEAFLSGRLGILSDQPKPFSPKKKEFDEKAPWERSDSGRRAELYQEEPFRRKPGDLHKEKAPWERSEDEYVERPYLANINFNKDKSETESVPPWVTSRSKDRQYLTTKDYSKGKVRKEKAPWERTDEDLEEVGRQRLARLNIHKDVQREKAPWEKSTPTEQQEFNEDSFLQRNHTQYEPQQDTNSPIENGVSHDFDESAFLQGRVPLVSGEGGQSNASRYSGAQYKKPTSFRDRAPWEKPDTDEESHGEFDERAFLAGKVAVVNQGEANTGPFAKNRFSQVPSKTFLRLTRSVSREQSPSVENTSDYLSAEDDDRLSNSSGDKNASNLRYVGNKIPSKTFLKLHRSMERRSAEPEPKGNDLHDMIMDDNISKQVEHVTIETKEPEVYLDHLKKSMECGNVKVAKIEPQAEATDF